jgi:NitT/TauT family transport system permease protein
MSERIFATPSSGRTGLTMSDLAVLLVVVAVLYLGVRLAVAAPGVVSGPAISLAPQSLPYYALLSLGRMSAAYLLSLTFSLGYGYLAARNRLAERWLMPLLDILQSVPILSFLPVVLLSLTAILPEDWAVELAAIVLIFTSQVWNLTFSFYQSMTTLPTDLREAAAVFRFSPWLRFKKVELPFAALGLIWNTVMSWAGGWFFLMAAEMFTLGDRDFRLPGLGAYLQTAANAGDLRALSWGIGVLITLIVLLDQLVWRPLLAWAERFNVSQVESDHRASSWFLDGLRRSHFVAWFDRWLFGPAMRGLDRLLNRPPAVVPPLEATASAPGGRWFPWLAGLILTLPVGYGLLMAGRLLLGLSLDQWAVIGLGAGATLLRVLVAVVIALAWTVPLGVFIGANPRAAAILQPIVQVLASVPATALFPVLLLGLLTLPGGGNLAAILLMLLGTQWYLLFNVIAGASAIPQDLYYTSDLLRLSGWRRWRTLILPALFPYIITGLITASGGAWNASIVAEYTNFAGQVSQVTGLGALITASTVEGNFALLLAATLTMIVLVVLINRLIWRRLYHLAEVRFRMDQ